MQTQQDNVRTPPVDDDDKERLFVRPDSTADVSIDETDDGLTEVTVPISSAAEHRSGIKMTQPALESMVEQLKDGTVGLWDDHGLDEMGWPEYRREDRYGWWVDGFLDDDDVVWGTARLLNGRERSETLTEELEQGAPVAFSIGYYALEDEWVEREDGERREVLRLDLLETSAVGVPDNPDAYADGPAKQIAHTLAESGVELDRQSTSAITAAITDGLQTMGTENTNSAGSDPDTDPDGAGTDDDPNQEQHAADAATIVGIFKSAVDEAQEILEADDEDDDDDDDDEEESDSDKDDEEENSAELGELRAEIEQLQSDKEDLEAKVDRVHSESRDSAGRQGMSPPAGDDEETNDETPDETNDNKPRNGLEEANLLVGN